MMVVSCSELATAFKVPTELQNKSKQSVLRTMKQVNEKARNGQACELLRDMDISNASIFLALDTTLWLRWNKPVGIGGHQAA